MTIFSFGADSTALFFTCSDLTEHGFCIDSLTEEDTVILTRNTLLQSDLSYSGVLELDVYTNPCGLLVFAHRSHQAKFIWCFPDFETVLSAVQTVNCSHVNAALYRWGENLWLVMDKNRPQFSEFGQDATGETYILPQLREHGVLLLPEGALSILQVNFS